MKCGQGVMVKDFWGAYAYRFIAQCEGRFLLISNTPEPRNGFLLADWRGLLRELVALTVPARMTEKVRTVEATGASGLYVGFALTYPLSVSDFVNLLGVPADEVRAELADLAVQYEV